MPHLGPPIDGIYVLSARCCCEPEQSHEVCILAVSSTVAPKSGWTIGNILATMVEAE